MVPARGPCVQVTAASNPELKVIKPDPELVERARAASMAHQAEFQAAARLDEGNLLDVAIRPDVAPAFLHGEQAAIPARAATDVAHTQNDDLTRDIRHMPTLTGPSLV